MYPVLAEMIRELWRDNLGPMYHYHVLPEGDWQWPRNATDLERQAASLTQDERDILVAGEEEDQLDVVNHHNVQDLSGFLDEVFDGDLYYNFCK